MLDIGAPNAFDESVAMMIGTGWRGKLDRISNKLGVALGRKLFVERFSNLPMTILGKEMLDRREALNAMSSVRHRLTHSTRLADKEIVEMFPDGGFTVGKPMYIPLDYPFLFGFFLQMFTEVIDEAFSLRFKLGRRLVKPEDLH